METKLKTSREGVYGSTLFTDYNSQLAEELPKSAKLVANFNKHPKRIAIFAFEHFTEEAPYAPEPTFDLLITIGSNTQWLNKLSESQLHFNTLTDFKNGYPCKNLANCTVLIKADEPEKLMELELSLQKYPQRTVLEVDLQAIQHNLALYRSKLPSDTKALAMVKAFSYGHGFEAAIALEQAGVDYLGVAVLAEGIDLRNNGIQCPIMVMNPELENFDKLIKYNLEPVLFTIEAIEALQFELENHEVANWPVHIKIDSGMHRVGFMPDEFPEMLETLESCPNLKVTSILSHFAASPQVEHDAFTLQQIERFNTESLQIIEALGLNPANVIRHLSNSGSVRRFEQANFDMVRMGIALYGSDGHIQGDLQNVSSLKSQITHIKTVAPGESMGYSRMKYADKPMRIAIVPVGYADGMNRKLGHEVGKVQINGQFAPIVGVVSMDMCHIDITGIEAELFDEVIFFGEGYTINEWAAALDTISYEIITQIGSRPKRVYIWEK